MNLLHVALALLIVMAPSQAQTTKVFTSPDRALRAVVLTSSTGESSVRIQGSSRRILLFRDGTSGDGSHGYGVVHAEWTADSQFFVVSAEATDGHQPWAHPIWIYSRAKNRVFDLRKMGAEAVANFTLKPPDVIEISVLDCENTSGDHQPLGPLIVSLRQLVSAERLPTPPFPAR